MVAPPSHRTRGWGSSQRIERVSLTSRFWQALDAGGRRECTGRDRTGIKRVGVVYFVGLGLEWDALVLDAQHLCTIVNSTVAVVVVAHRAIQQVIGQNAIERFRAGGLFARGGRGCAPPCRVKPRSHRRAPVRRRFSTRHVSQVWMGAELGVGSRRGEARPRNGAITSMRRSPACALLGELSMRIFI